MVWYCEVTWNKEEICFYFKLKHNRSNIQFIFMFHLIIYRYYIGIL